MQCAVRRDSIWFVTWVLVRFLGGGIFFGRVGGWTAIRTPPRFGPFLSSDDRNPALVVATHYWDAVCDVARSESGDEESIGTLFFFGGGVGRAGSWTTHYVPRFTHFPS